MGISAKPFGKNKSFFVKMENTLIANQQAAKKAESQKSKKSGK